MKTQEFPGVIELKVPVHKDERIDDLQYMGLMLIQKKDGFCFGVDAVLLAHFSDIRKNDKVIDLGTGTGIIPVLLAGKTEAGEITGLEIQPDICEMAERSIRLNELDFKVKIVNGDIKRAVEYFGPSAFNAVVTNPPYMNRGGGLINPEDAKAIARHEIMCSLEDVIAASSKLLVPGGRFSMVHRPDRLVDIIYLMRRYGIEPKYLRFVHPAPYKKANLLLIKGTRGGKPLLRMMEPLYVYKSEGNYSDEINMIYSRDISETV